MSMPLRSVPPHTLARMRKTNDKTSAQIRRRRVEYLNKLAEPYWEQGREVVIGDTFILVSKTAPKPTRGSDWPLRLFVCVTLSSVAALVAASLP